MILEYTEQICLEIIHCLFLQFCRAFVSALANGNTLRVFKVQKKTDGTGNTITGEFDFPQQHKADIINVGVSATGKFIMSCSNDTTIVIWNLKGNSLKTLWRATVVSVGRLFSRCFVEVINTFISYNLSLLP